MPINCNIHPMSAIRCAVAIFIVSAALNYVWEIAQSPLFAGMDNLGNMWWHCLVASLGDGVIVLIIHVAGWCVFRRSDWFMHPGVTGYSVMLVTGVIVAVVVEWVAVHAIHRWTYTTRMPLIPGTDIGLVPILQMLILPPAVFYIVAAWATRKKVHVRK